MSKSDATKAQIMRAAVLQFTRTGYEGTAVRQIADAAGVNMGLIRYHFGHKADVYRDTLAYLAEPYNQVCLAALHAAQARGAGAEEQIAAWLLAPLTDWQEAAVASGEEVLCFLNKMGYEDPELTREVYESHYSYAWQEWQESVRAFFPAMAEGDWLWCLSCLRGMYFAMVAQSETSPLWALPPIHNKEAAVRRLAADAAAMMRSYGAGQGA